ncbi:inositol polyphosphate multikinase [Nematolebias whitei]|uniref:inositol polyphosphate multikinase n=1 Tax=Nematolebias whitei TaxID=451745 RepID=UPI00189AF0CE|nr:inositol polyphosphate multikinase [Nematolebias whitei]
MMKSSVPLEDLAPGSDLVPLKEGSGQRAHLNGCVPLSHQVAGHKYGVDKVGILQHPDGTVLKQVQPPPRGPREVHFYNMVFAEDCSDPCLLDLQNHIPKYYGTWSSPDSPKDLYLKLEDVTSRFVRPCIMDVKLGQRSYDPFASQEKREQQIRKYPLMEEIGFLILGMRVYNVQRDTFDSYNQHYGRSLVKDTVKDGLATFFNNGAYLRKDAIWASVHRVRQILHWFNSQHQLAFYASSLLFVYEGLPSSSSPSSLSSLLNNPSVVDTKKKTTKLLLMGDGGQDQDHGANEEGLNRENEAVEHNNNTEEATNYTNQRRKGYLLCGRACHLNNSVSAQVRTASASGGPASALCEEDNTRQHTGSLKLSPNENGDESSLTGNDAEEERKMSSRTEEEEGGMKGPRGGGPDNTEDLEVEVRMIDFAHVFPSDGYDQGYMYGLKHLLTVLEQVLCDAAQSSPSSTS